MRLKFLALTTVLLVLSRPCAFAITVLPLSEEELAKRATVIVTGEVLEVGADYDAQHNTIYTYITTRITDVLKGDYEDTFLTLRQMGGTVGDQTVTVPGSPAYELGDEILVFAGPLGQTGYYGVLGIFYGKYDIILDPQTGKKYVDGASFHVEHTDPETLKPLPKKVRPELVYLDSFLSEIRSYVEKD